MAGSSRERILLDWSFMSQVRLWCLLAACLVGLSCKASPSDHVKRAEQYVAEKKYAEAVIEYRTALQLARGDQRRAEASFKTAINADPKSGAARVALANFYRSQHRDKEAEEELREAAHLEPKNVQVNSNLVELYIRTGRARQAEAP